MTTAMISPLLPRTA
nr:hypothetical protein [Tanacetum cinerariifolium]